MTEFTQNSSTIIVVGNRFSAFAEAIGAITLGEFLSKTAHELRNYDTVIVGQGVGWHAIHALYANIGLLLESGQLTLIENASALVSPGTVHKQRMENVMVTHPKAVSEHRFVSHLVVDENCAELSDHITGIHMQGTLFIEAARQMFMASSVRYVKELSHQNHVYTLQRVQVGFKNFLYP
nr:hypothetical protein [candidate division Zixibacteria bacterium]